MKGEKTKVMVNASVAVKRFAEEYTREALTLRDSYKEGLVDLIDPPYYPMRSSTIVKA